MELYNITDMHIALIKNNASMTGNNLTSFLADNILDDSYVNIGTRLGTRQNEVVIYGKLDEDLGNQDILSFFVDSGGYLYIDLVDLLESHTSSAKQAETFLEAIGGHYDLITYGEPEAPKADSDDEYAEALYSLLDISEAHNLSEDTLGLLMETLDSYGVKAAQMLLDAKGDVPELLSKLIKELDD
mgnify:CR=1 FL=1